MEEKLINYKEDTFKLCGDDHNTIFNEECLKTMDYLIENNIKVDAIITDPPYGTTSCKWDSVIPFEDMWERLNKLIKDNGAIVLFGRQPFTSQLICSNIKNYKHIWIWNKKQSGSFANAKYMPLQIQEDIVVFCNKNKKVNYYPIMRKGKMRKKGDSKKCMQTMSGIGCNYYTYNDLYYPVNIVEFANCKYRIKNVHPTQKPVELLEYLVKTYTNEGETVLDFTMGSGSTGVACKHTNRNFIGIELDKNYFDIAKQRIEKE